MRLKTPRFRRWLIALLVCSTPTVAASRDCPLVFPTPYTGPLEIESKYVQSDATKSTLKEDISADSTRIKTHIESFSKKLVAVSNEYIRSADPARKALAVTCFDQGLRSWAEAGALMSEQTTKTGTAMRKWTLAAIASTVLKMQTLTGGDFELSEAQRLWLADLADRVVTEYTPRLDPDFRYFNNHDYWAAWAVTATGMALNDERLRAWGYQGFHRAMKQINMETGRNIGWLPNEVAREELASDYTHYALVPLALLAAHAAENGFPLSPTDEKHLRALANFAVLAVLRPEQVSDILAANQRQVSPHKMAWLIPFLALYPEHRLARELYTARNEDVDGYSQIGGIIRPLYEMPARKANPSPPRSLKIDPGSASREPSS